MELIGTLPDAPEHLDEELALRLAIGGPLIATKGYPAPEVERTYSRAWALCDQLGRSAELFPVLRGLWNCHFVRGELQRAHDLAERLVALAEEQGTPLRRALARRALGTTLFFLGRFADATAALDEGIAIDDAVAAWEDPAHLLLYTERAGVAVPAVFGMGPLVPRLPRPRLGEDRSWRSPSANGSRTPYSLAFALSWAAVLHNLRREFDCGAKASRGGDRSRERASPAAVARGRHHVPGLCSGRPRSAGGGDRTASDRLGRLEWRAVPTCSIPSGLASSPKPIFRRVSSTMRSPRWIGRPKPPRRPASATIKRSCTG